MMLIIERIRAFGSDLKLLPRMWRLAVENVRSRDILDRVAADAIVSNDGSLDALMRLSPYLRSIPQVQITAALSMYFAEVLREQKDAGQ